MIIIFLFLLLTSLRNSCKALYKLSKVKLKLTSLGMAGSPEENQQHKANDEQRDDTDIDGSLQRRYRIAFLDVLLFAWEQNKDRN